MNIDLDALRTLVAAIEERSLARAAEREGLVTSAVSKRITELERNLGIAVLQRHNRGVVPTAAGSALYHRAKAILGQVSGLSSFVEDYAGDGSPKIQLAANRSAIILFLPTELKRYQATQSQRVRVDLLEAYSSEIPRLIVEKNLDIGIYHALDRRRVCTHCLITGIEWCSSFLTAIHSSATRRFAWTRRGSSISWDIFRGILSRISWNWRGTA